MAKRIAFVQLGAMRVQWFAELARRMAPEFDSCFYSTETDARSILRQVGMRIIPERLPLRAALQGYRLSESDWEVPLGAGSPIDPVLSEGSRADLKEIIESKDARAVVMWGGWGRAAQIAAALAQSRDCKAVYLEEGPSPSTMQVGVNGIGPNSEFARRYANGPDPSGTQLRCAYPQMTEASGHHITPSLLSMMPRWLHRASRPRALLRGLSARTVPLPSGGPPAGRFVLVPFQVSHYALLSTLSPVFGNDQIRIVMALRRSLQQIDPAVGIVVKLHPKELRATNVAHMASLRSLPGVTVLNHAATGELLRACEAVVVINSLAGYQAIALGKPVVALGQSFYSHRDIVERVGSERELTGVLKRTLKNPPATAARSRFINRVEQEYLVHAHWRNYSAQSFEEFGQRLRAIAGN